MLRHRLAANRARFAHRLLALGGIDDQSDLVVFYHIDDVRATLAHFVDAPADDARLLQHLRGAAGGGDLEAARDQHLREQHRAGLVAVAHADEAQAARRQDHPGGGLRLGIGLAEGVPGAHDFARGFHLRTQDGIGLGELDEREHRLLHREVRRNALARCCPCAASVLPVMTRAATLASGMPVALETNGTVREARGLTSRI